MATSVTNPQNVVITISQAGTDCFSTTSTAYAEVLGVDGFSISPGKKDVEMVTGFASTDANRFHIVEKSAEIAEITLDHAIFDSATFLDYFYSSTFAARGTKTLCLGIKWTAEDASVEKWKFDNAYVTDIEPEGSSDNAVKASVTLKCTPADASHDVS